MTDTAWHRQKRHYGELHRRLGEEGFEVLGAAKNGHLRLRVRRGGRETTLTCSGTPRDSRNAVNGTMRQARRALPETP